MRVLLVSASSGSRGGGEFYFHGLAIGLVEAGHDVSLMLSDGTHMDEFAETMEGCCTVIRVPMTNTYHRRARVLGAVLDSRSRRELAERFRSFQPDMLHINKQNLEDGLELMLAARDCGTPAVATIHVTRTMARLGAAGGLLRDYLTHRTLLRAGIPLIGTSPQCTAELQEFVGNSIPCFDVPNGAFRVHGARATVRSEWGVSESDVVIGVLARIESQKNPLFVPKLLSRLPSAAKVVWIGDGALRGSLENEIAENGVEDRFVLDGWQKDGRNRMSGFDIFVLPSLYEGFPFAILEAMSAGLPCVVSDVDGTRDAVRDGENGFLCELNDVDKWVSVLEPLVQSAEQRLQIGTVAKEQFETNFSIDAMAARTSRTYELVQDWHAENNKL